MPSQLTLYNNALLIIGERKLSSLSENREARRLLDTVWDRDARRDCLQLGQWNFALRTVEIEYSPSVDPPFGYQYAFDRPSDLVRTCAVCSDEHFRIPLLQYQTEGAYWFADINPLYVRYVSDGASYGTDYSLWPGNFTRMVEAYLADAIVQRLTGDKQEWGRVQEVYRKAKKEALSTDALEQPTATTPAGSWVRSRIRGSGGDRGSNTNLIG